VNTGSTKAKRTPRAQGNSRRACRNKISPTRRGKCFDEGRKPTRSRVCKRVGIAPFDGLSSRVTRHSPPRPCRWPLAHHHTTTTWIKAWLDLVCKDTLRQYYWYDARDGEANETTDGEGLRFFVAARAWMGGRRASEKWARMQVEGRESRRGGGSCVYACVRAWAGGLSSRSPGPFGPAC
jgi:hypothetical protein